MKSFVRYRVLPTLLVTLLLGGLTNGVAHAATAATAPKTTTGVANSMKVSPLRSDITVKQGDSKTVQVSITNLSSTAVVLQPIENDFVAGDEKGTPAIILDQASYAPTHSLKRFMTPLQNITVAPRATSTVNLTVTVPLTAQAGGYFGALRFAPVTKENQPVSLSSSVASLVLLTVPGPAVEKLDLTNFDIQQKGQSATSFRTPSDLSVFVRFKNEGNLQLAPFGQIAVTQGKKVVDTSNFNQADPKAVILPDSARRWDVPLQNIGKFGKYTVTGTFGYGNGQSLEVKKTVWIVPTSYIIAAVVGVIGLVLVFAVIRIVLNRGHARYRRRR